MTLEFKFKNLVLGSKYFVQIFVLATVLLIYFHFNAYEYMFYALIVLTAIYLLLFMIITCNYMIKSRGLFVLDILNKTIKSSEYEIDINQISNIEKVQSLGPPQNDIQVLPWLSGIYFYYKFRIKGENYFITSYMINEDQSEKLDSIFFGKMKVTKKFFPIII